MHPGIGKCNCTRSRTRQCGLRGVYFIPKIAYGIGFIIMNQNFAPYYAEGLLGNTQTPCELPARRHHGPMAAPRSNVNTQTASSSCPWSGLCPPRVGFPPCGAEGDMSVSHAPGPAVPPEPQTQQLQRSAWHNILKQPKFPLEGMTADVSSQCPPPVAHTLTRKTRQCRNRV